MPPRAKRLWMAYWLRWVICGSSIDGTNVSISLDLPIHTRYTLLHRFKCQAFTREINFSSMIQFSGVDWMYTKGFLLCQTALSTQPTAEESIPVRAVGYHINNVAVISHYQPGDQGDCPPKR